MFASVTLEGIVAAGVQDGVRAGLNGGGVLGLVRLRDDDVAVRQDLGPADAVEAQPARADDQEGSPRRGGRGGLGC